MKKDIVCGMKIQKPENILTVAYNNVTYSFCSELCKIKFLMDPEKYISRNSHDANGK